MTRLALLVALAPGVAACSLARSLPATHYYRLALPERTPVRLAAPVRVGRFTAERTYWSARLAYRTSPFRLDYYTYHRWVAPPGELVAAAVREYLGGAQGPAAGGPPLEIEGHVRRFEEVDAAAGRAGDLAVDVAVRRGGRVLLERTYAESEPAAAREPEAIAAALSRALARVLDRMVAELDGAPRPGP